MKTPIKNALTRLLIDKNCERKIIYLMFKHYYKLVLKIKNIVKSLYFCEICYHTSEKLKYHKKHLKTIHNIFENFPCEFCDKSYENKSSLDTHIKKKHLNNERFMCPYPFCKIKTLYKWEILYHIEIKHENKMHKCDVENCSYENKYNRE